MEFFEKPVAVRLKTHLDKYLVADDDQLSIRQSHNTTPRARWLIEHVDSNKHVIRLKSCYGRYLTASNTPFLLGMTGKKVFQTQLQPENKFAIEWQPLRDGFQVKLKSASCGTYLRANGATLPWRNTVTHDNSSFTSSTHNWILFDVEEDVAEEEFNNNNLCMVSGLELHTRSFSSSLLPVFSIINKRRNCSFQVITTSSSSSSRQWVMDLFHNAKAVRLKNHHNKYLHAEEDEESVSQDRNGSSKNNRWTVEFVNDHDDNSTFIRLKSCYNKYLTASNHPFLLGMTGRKVLQTLPRRLDSSVEWEPIREGNQVKLRTRYGQYLRANGGLPPWRNSVTHDVPQRTATQEWILWDVDVVDIILLQSPTPTPTPLPLDSSFTTSQSDSTLSPSYSRQQSGNDSWQQQQIGSSSPPKLVEQVGRAIYYHVVSDDFGEMDENAQGFCIYFKGNNLNQLTQMLQQETGLNNITICTRSPLNGNLYPLRLQLPPNNVTMNVVVVQNNQQDTTADDF